MQLHVKSVGGQSPGIMITGDRDSLLALADQIKAGAATVDDGPVRKDVFPAIGEPCDWVQFRVSKSMPSVVRLHNAKTGGILAFVAFFYASLPVFAYLIYRGVRSFF